MSIVMTVAMFSIFLLVLHAFGVFAMCLQAGENLISSVTEATGWLAVFAVSQFLSYLALPLH